MQILMSNNSLSLDEVLTLQANYPSLKFSLLRKNQVHMYFILSDAQLLHLPKTYLIKMVRHTISVSYVAL